MGVYVRALAKEEAQKAAKETAEDVMRRELAPMVRPIVEEWLATKGIAELMATAQMTAPATATNSPMLRIELLPAKKTHDHARPISRGDPQLR
jgi:hypothetical protein